MKIRFHRAASKEIVDAAEYYDLHRSGLDIEFVTELNAGFSQIQTDPNTWPTIGKHARQYKIHRFPYRIIYILKGEKILILAVSHLSRRPGYWKSRLK